MVEKGETVWVQFAGKNEEPATVIEELNVEPGEAASLSEEKKDYSGTGDILVRTFDGVEVLVSKDKCRFLGRTGQRNNLRRSTRGIANKPLLGSTAQGAKEKVTPMVMDLQQARSIAEESEDEGFDDMSLAQIKEKSDSKKGVAVKTDERKRKSCKGEPSKPDQEECEFEGASAKKRRKSKSTPKRKQVEMKDPSSPFFESKAKKIVKETVTNEKKFGGDTRKKAKRDGTAESELTATKKKAGRAKTKRNDKDEPGRSPSSRKAGLIDGNGGLDQGASYVIEQAKTSRSTCKRCDIRINKGTLRVGHRPLFRGKPGYQVFKHLECAIFSEDITRAEDVAGCEFLGDEDYDALTRRVEESLEEIQAEKEELEPDELVQKQFDGEKRPSPKGLIANLLPFQEEGTSWMYSQEKDVDGVRGGILADEMGMGKTLQTISTILDNRPRLQRCIPGGKYPPCTSEERKDIDIEEKLWAKAKKEWLYEMKMNDVVDSLLPKSSKKGEPEGGARSGTLIVCPLIALSQWRSEIDKFCESNALSVCIYHGPDRVKIIPRNMMVKYDIVLTTYQVLEADFRKMTSPNKVKCPNCGGKFKVDKLRVHLKYFCGEGAQRTEAQSRTIRNSERGNGDEFRRRRASNSSNGSRGKGKNPKGKKSSKVTKAGSKSFKIDLSFKEEDALVKKSPRNAAVKARRRLKSFRESTPESDDENFSLDSDSDGCSDDFDDDDVCYSSEEDVVMKKAVAKQAEAMKTVKAGKKKFSKGKVTEKKNMNKIGAKKGGKKGKASGLDESASDNDSEDDDIGIDMDALAAEAMAGASMSNLHSVCWWRVILDEAHMIKSRSSQTSHAAFALTGIHRWCLSGTPLQNRVGEFYSLIRFLRLDPMAHYLCRAKGCDCKQIHYRMMNGICRSCGHGSVQHYSHFNRHILNPIQRDGYCHDGRRAMFCLKNEVLDKCLLRRTKETRAEEMNLPPRVVTIKAVRLHPVEEDFYNALYTQTTSSFTDYVTSGTLLNNYAHIFDLLMRMRQSVAHPYLVIHSKKGLGTENTSPAVSNGRIDCHLCNEPPSERVISTCCETAFCKSCVLDYMEMSSGAGAGAGAVTQCPQCNEPFTIDLNQIQEDSNEMDSLQNGKEEAISTLGLPSLKELHHVATGSILRKIDLTKFATSTKIEALTKELVEMRKTSPGSKAIIFSQFVNMLDLIRWRLHSDPFLSDIGLGARALHGGMDVKSRDEALKEFREDPNVRVLLMSLKAGGVALNLTVANYVYLMDPWWNPAAELQAIDRTHRLGQYRPIRAVRFIAENTVEERILQLQEKKRLVFDGTVGRDAGSLKMLTVDDMKSLFA